MDVFNKKVAVLGAGRSGRAAAGLLKKHGANVTVFDTGKNVAGWPSDIPLVLSATERDGVEYEAELVVISPGIETLSSFVTSFCGKADELIGETELACRFYDGVIIAITGTNGKTTTTALIEHILKKAGKNAVACGNYGVPLSELLLKENKADILAMEVSSFQMETIRLFRPDIAIWLNFAPDHMDRYGTEQEYYDAKLHVFDNQTEKDLAIIRYEEELTEPKAEKRYFSSQSIDGDLCYRDGGIYAGDEQVLSLIGTGLNHSHNAENVMAATLACRRLGVDYETIQAAVLDFAAPGHRCELVRTLDGVEWYNDSKATNLHAVEAALASINKPIVWIAGGKDKGLDYSPLIPLLKERVKHAIVFGEIGDQLDHTFHEHVPTDRCQSLSDCVNIAREKSVPGDIVLFSPGTSSFDMFADYVQRGQAFREAVVLLSSQNTPPKQ